MEREKLKRLIDRLHEKCSIDPSLTNDFTGEISLNVTQGGLNKIVFHRHVPVQNKEKEQK